MWGYIDIRLKISYLKLFFAKNTNLPTQVHEITIVKLMKGLCEITLGMTGLFA